MWSFAVIYHGVYERIIAASSLHMLLSCAPLKPTKFLRL